MACGMCQDRGKDWNGSDPVCYFDNEYGDNWNCATVNAIRDIAYEGSPKRYGVNYQYCDDQKYATIKCDDLEFDGEYPWLCLWVSWYKNRGRTDALWLLGDDRPPRRPTEQELLTIIGAYQ